MVATAEFMFSEDFVSVTFSAFLIAQFGLSADGRKGEFLNAVRKKTERLVPKRARLIACFASQPESCEG